MRQEFAADTAGQMPQVSGANLFDMITLRELTYNSLDDAPGFVEPAQIFRRTSLLHVVPSRSLQKDAHIQQVLFVSFEEDVAFIAQRFERRQMGHVEESFALIDIGGGDRHAHDCAGCVDQKMPFEAVIMQILAGTEAVVRSLFESFGEIRPPKIADRQRQSVYDPELVVVGNERRHELLPQLFFACPQVRGLADEDATLRDSREQIVLKYEWMSSSQSLPKNSPTISIVMTSESLSFG